MEVVGAGGGLCHHSAPPMLARRGPGKDEEHPPKEMPATVLLPELRRCKRMCASLRPRSSCLLLLQWYTAMHTPTRSKVADGLVPLFVCRDHSSYLQLPRDFALWL